MKYAVVQYNGKQYKVSEGDVVEVEGTLDPASSFEFKDVLVIGGDSIKIGTPLVKGAVVKATILGNKKGEKIRVAKFKAKSNYHRVVGYRSQLTQVRIDSI